MPTNFPTSLDSLTNPVSTDTTAAVDHAAQHANANDAIEAIEAKVGIDSSTSPATLEVRSTTICTSSTRPTAVLGRSIYETDTDAWMYWDGAAWTGLVGAWTPYTPTLTNFTLNGGTMIGRYLQIGNTVFMSVFITAGTPVPTFTGTVGISLPVTAASSIRRSMFRAEYADASPLTGYIGSVGVTTTRVDLFVINTAGTYATTAGVSATVPFSVASGDTYEVSGIYPAA